MDCFKKNYNTIKNYLNGKYIKIMFREIIKAVCIYEATGTTCTDDKRQLKRKKLI